MSITISFAEKCAWRAIYIHRGKDTNPKASPNCYYRHGRQLAFLGIDPTSGKGPQLFGGFDLVPSDKNGYPIREGWRAGWYWSGRWVIPHIRWQWPMPRWKAAIYRIQQRILHGLDGRYGWGAEAWERERQRMKEGGEGAE